MTIKPKIKMEKKILNKLFFLQLFAPKIHNKIESFLFRTLNLCSAILDGPLAIHVKMNGRAFPVARTIPILLNLKDTILLIYILTFSFLSSHEFKHFSF